jgi:hypothetical protein
MDIGEQLGFLWIKKVTVPLERRGGRRRKRRAVGRVPIDRPSVGPFM